MTFAISAAVLAVLSLVLGGAVHAWLLGPEYAKLTTLFRPPADHQGYFAYMILAHVAIGVGFTWIYRQGRERKPFLGQGVRFGIAVSVLAVVPMYLIYYAVQPMPGVLVAKQIVFDSICYVVLGIVCAWINQRDMPAVGSP
jgi:hypothetical protein